MNHKKLLRDLRQRIWAKKIRAYFHNFTLARRQYLQAIQEKREEVIERELRYLKYQRKLNSKHLKRD